MEERLQKIISACGLLSRRSAEEAISAGRVTVQGRVASLGEKADPERDEICLDGARIQAGETRVCLVLNKPAGYVTTMHDEQGRPSVDQLVKGCGLRVYPVGRLDLNSEGLLLMTNDGDLTHRLTHPSHEVEKEYYAWVTGDTQRGIPKLSGPLWLDGVELYPAQVKIVGKNPGSTCISIVIHEGKNRQVRRMCSQVGLKVVRLRRVREGALCLGTLKPGQWRYLTDDEIELLRQG